MLALLAVFNLAVAPLAHAAFPPRDPGAASIVELAADLKATFGDAFQLCVNGDGSLPDAPSHHEHDCPLCCLHAGAALPAPDAVSLPTRREAPSSLVFVAANFAPPPPARASPAQPRAPPALS